MADNPIAVAFVEIRPEASDFGAEAEAEIRESLGPEGFDVQGNLKLNGLETAKRDVDALTRSLETAGGQLRIEGLETASTDAEALQATLAETADLDLAGTLAPLQEGAAASRQEIDALASAVQGIPSLGGGLTTDLLDASGATGALATDTEELAEALSGAGDATANVAQIASLAARNEGQLAAATAATTRETKQAMVEETALERIRVRSRRAFGVGPFRFAGAGLAIGTAVFAATRAIGDLANALEVSDVQTATMETRFRNFAANTLRGDVVGAFTALTDETNTYSEAQLRAITSTEGLEDALRSMGEAGDLAKSALAAAQGLTQAPQETQTALAVAQFHGDEGATLRELEQADRQFADQAERVKQLPLERGVILAALEEIFRQRTSIREQIEALGGASADPLRAFRVAVTKAEIGGDSGQVVAALQAQASEIRKIVTASDTSAAERETLLGELKGVNDRIESAQDAIVAEEARHQEEMREKRIQPFRIEALKAELAGDTQGVISALQAQAGAIRDILSSKTLDASTREQYLGQLISVNSQIESIQDSIRAEEERHAAEIEAARADAHQATLDGLGIEEQRLQNQELAASLTAGLADDIRRTEALRDFYAKQARNQQLTEAERLRFQGLFLSTRARLGSLRQQQREAAREEAQAERDAREQILRDNLELAQLNDRSTSDDERALRRLIQFLRKQAKNRELSLQQRRAYLLEQRRAEAQLRDLLGEAKEQGQSFAQTAFEFLQAQAGFAAQLAGNLLPEDFTLAPPRTSTTSAPPPLPGGGAGRDPSNIPSPFEHGRGQGSSTTGALALRDAGGKAFSGGQGEELISLSRETLDVLRDIRRGAGFQESKYSRAVNAGSTNTEVQ